MISPKILFSSQIFQFLQAVLREGKVKVFEQPSRGNNMLLYVKDRLDRNTDLEKLGKPKKDPYAESEADETPKVDPDFLKEVADRLLGKEIHVSWPHLITARYKLGIMDVF